MSKRSKVLLSILLITTVVGVLGVVFRERLIGLFFQPTHSTIIEERVDDRAVSTFAYGLATPWSITFLPDGDMLVTERSGQMKRIGDNGKTYLITGVRETSEGGLLGVALHPNFSDNQRLYLYFTTEINGALSNQVDEYRLENNLLSHARTVLAGVPAADNHNGGAIAFGPDDKLYVTTGDAAQEQLAQDRNSLAGKILRLNDDGTTPPDNPFDNPVWSYGHRNPQGIAWDDKGQLWSVEHGPSGAESGRDELNRIDKGANYGWPTITGHETAENMRSPVAQSGDDETWAPAGLAYLDGSLYFAGLRGQSLYHVTIHDTDVSLTKYFSTTYGRLRAVTTHDDKLYVSTSNRDGRGSPAADDDKILRFDPARL